ncbi:hypothetical protein DH2020_000937 [Rehmannia glutinosa]|uniref:UBA domain-containing protein n=1 Tax=Rehmannia glutinosa TaxID=99300 RepID=A0ABR0XY02_REHGL
MEVDKRLLGELEAMGFSEALATKALCSSGNSSIEDAVNWLVDHENDTAASETPMQPRILVNISIEASNPLRISEQVKLRAQALRFVYYALYVKALVALFSVWERIRSGKELLESKRMAEESERKRFLAQRKAEKEEERRARDKIRQKLQQDKLERQGILGLPREVPLPVKPDTALPQTTKLTLLFACKACCGGEYRNNDGIRTLLIYVKNIINNPDEEKFRKIRISNPVFQDRVGKFEDGIKFLELCGFERVEGGNFCCYTEKKTDTGVLKSAASELQNALMNPFFGLLSG